MTLQQAPNRAALLVAPALVAAPIASAWTYVAVVDPSTTGVSLCPFLLLTGWDCPLCGGTRGAHALAHGDLGGAMSYNAMTAVLVPVAMVLLVVWAVRRARGHEAVLLPDLGRSWWIGLAAVAAVFTVVRNVPFGSVLGA